MQRLTASEDTETVVRALGSSNCDGRLPLPPPPQLLGVSLAKELASEFSSARSSEMGLSWEFHRASHFSFEQNGTLLVPSFSHTAFISDCLI